MVFDAKGKVLTEFTVNPASGGTPPLNIIPRIGITAGLNSSMREIEWLGLGPDETYSDRKTSGHFGLFKADALTWNHRFFPPQETGHRSDVRWARFTDTKNNGVQIAAASGAFGFSLWPWTIEDLEKKAYPGPSGASGDLTLIVDHAQMGLGGVTWATRPLDQYAVGAGKTYKFDLLIKPAR